YTQALTIFEALSDRRGMAGAAAGIGESYEKMGDCASAIPVLERARDLARQVSASDYEAWALMALAVCRVATGDPAQAVELSGQALALARATGNREYLRAALESAGRSQQAQGAHEAAR